MRYRAALIGAWLLSGCATSPILQERLTQPTVELKQTPFFPQEVYQCGPAALATVLRHAGAAVTPEELVPQVFLPGREGSLQLELVGATRRQGLIPLRIRGEIQAIATALAAGYPVLVLQNMRFDFWPQWHYAVVIGLDLERDEVILRSGTFERHVMSARRFLGTWIRAKNWGMVVALPQNPPAFVSVKGWVEAVNGLETTGQVATAQLAYTAAAQRWPDQAEVWLALGNSHYAAGNKREAVRAYEQAVKISAPAEAYNNLAHTLAELGCAQEARGLIAEGLQRAADSPWLPRLQKTAAEIQQAQQQIDCVYRPSVP